MQGDIAYIKDRNEHLILRQSEARKKVEEIQKAVEAFEADLQDYEQAEQKYKAVNEALIEAQQEYKSAQSKIESLQTELSGLRGLFAGMRKRALEEQIEKENRELQSKQDMIQSLEGQCKRAMEKRRERPVMSIPEIAVPDLPDEREVTYQCAKIYAEVQLYGEAGREYNKIRGYKDVDSIIEKDGSIAAVANDDWRGQFAVGNTVQWGRYEQDGDSSNGAEVIEWLVLANNGDTATLISKYGLDARAYSTNMQNVTWENCSLRSWLNGEFLNAAFSAVERSILETVTVTADKNPKYSTDPGKDTQDTVFLLSVAEANALFDSGKARKCQATSYAKLQGADVSCWWWLRSPGIYSNRAANVDDDGSVYYSGNGVLNQNGVVRPVVVVRLK